MIINPNEKKDRIDVLKDILYSKNEDKLLNRRRHPLKDKGDFYGSPTEWEEEKESSIKIPYTKILLGAFIFFILAFGFAFYKFFVGSNTVSGDNIDILISGPVSIAGGEEFALDIEVKNKNNVNLQVVDLRVEYPEGTRSPDDLSTELKRHSEIIGDMGIGESSNKIIKAVLFGEENSQKIISINVEYRIPGSNAVFNKQKDYIILISSSPVNIKVSGPEEVNANQQVDFQIDITSNSLSIVNNLILKVDYPFGFNVVSTNPSSVSSNNSIFDLGDLEPGSKRSIRVSGLFQGQDGEDRILKFNVGTPKIDDGSQVATTFTSITKSIAIKKPFVGLVFSINDNKNKEVAINTDTKVEANLSWVNNLTENLYNVVIQIKINGSLLNGGSFIFDSKKGFYNSYNNSIVFDKNSDQSLSTIKPGDSGAFRFNFSSFSPSMKPTISFNSSNVIMETTVFGNRANDSETSDEILFSDTKTIKISSNLNLLSKGYRTVGPFQNTGPFPPKVDNDSTYTITWVATNSFNNIKSAKVSSILPSNVRWTSYISPSTEKISFNQDTGEVVWDIGDVKANTGDKYPARSVSFQIAVIPSISQLGEELNLLNETTISGIDSYSGAKIGEVRSAITTKITSDPIYIENIGRVIQ